MQAQERAQTAWEFLYDADRQFAAGDVLQGSEKLWGAAAHAVMTVAQRQDLPYGTHHALKTAADQLAKRRSDPSLEAGFFAAQQFHANFYHDFMEDDDIARGRPLVRRFVERVLIET